MEHAVVVVIAVIVVIVVVVGNHKCSYFSKMFIDLSEVLGHIRWASVHNE